MLGVLSKVFHWCVRFVSGEFLLSWPRRHANGGTMVLVRSVWVSIVLYALTLSLRELLDPLKSSTFDSGALRVLVFQTLPLFGALFTGVYFALYARFSSQWTYLAGLYNQIMGAMARRERDPEVIASWKSAFIEDAEELHLALKPMYAAVIKKWSAEESVRVSFARDAPGGLRRLQTLLAEVDRIYKQVGEKWGSEDDLIAPPR